MRDRRRSVRRAGPGGTFATPSSRQEAKAAGKPQVYEPRSQPRAAFSIETELRRALDRTS
jgi:hypothetical protein